MDLAKLMIEKGAREWNSGLRDACEGGHLDLAELMIEKGATNQNINEKSPSNVKNLLNQRKKVL
jgi:hypothetical protein